MTVENPPLKNPIEDHEYFANRVSYLDPGKECDFVMQGGIASGVIYPPAILTLAPRYRFRGIGGASAGAIAAGAAAAAEFGREQKKYEHSGFVGLHEMQQELLTESFIKSLFRPSEQTRTLYDAFFTLKDHYDKDTAKKEEKNRGQRAAEASATTHAGPVDDAPMSEIEEIRALANVIVPFVKLWGPRVTAALRTPAPAGQDTRTGDGFLAKLASNVGQLGRGWLDKVRGKGGGDPGAVLAAGMPTSPARLSVDPGGLFGIVREVMKASRVLSNRDESYFGFCRGSWGGERKAEDPPQLTDWLHEGFNRLADKAVGVPPLTIKELKDKTIKDPDGKIKIVSIEFKMVTTNLSKTQPYLFPREEMDLFFKESDLRKLFPPCVVDYLIEIAKEDPPRTFRLPAGYFLLPPGDDLPVIVAVRLSLSFPVLLSAVRLYSAKGDSFPKIKEEKSARQAQKPWTGEVHDLSEEDLEENWFSDGGIANNFPLTMFDSWVPLRPTFGINLRESALVGDEQKPPTIADESFVFRPEASEHADLLPRSKVIVNFPKFFLAMLDTAQNYRDNAQVTLASYRERVAQVYLTPSEGGLNLVMSKATLEAIGQKGVLAAQKLDQLDFREHLWVRTRVLMSHIEQEAFRLRDSNNSIEWLDEEFKTLIDEQLKRPEGQRWYRSLSKEWCDEALVRLETLTVMMKAWNEAPTLLKAPSFFQQDPPSPGGTLRITPKI